MDKNDLRKSFIVLQNIISRTIINKTHPLLLVVGIVLYSVFPHRQRKHKCNRNSKIYVGLIGIGAYTMYTGNKVAQYQYLRSSKFVKLYTVS